MKKLVILIMMIILMGCGDKEITEKDIKTLTEGEKQALLLINRVTSKSPNIITIKDRLIVDSLIVELYGKGVLKGGTKENLESIGLARILKAGGINKTDGFNEKFKKEIKLVKSLRIPQLHTYIIDNYLVSDYENVKIKWKIFKDKNGSFQLTDYLEYYYNNKLVTITKEQEELALEFLKYNPIINGYIEGKQKYIFLDEDDNGNTIALKIEESQNKNITKQIIYNYLGERYIEAEYFKGELPIKVKVYNLLGENTLDFERKEVNGKLKSTFKFFKDGNKIIEFEKDNIIRSFDSEGNVKGTIDLDTGMLDEVDGGYKIQGRYLDKEDMIIYVMDISKLFKIKTLKDVYTNIITGLKVITEYENDKVIKKEVWKDFGKHGESKEWYLNGNLKSTKKYYYGKLIDNSKEYYENGAIKELVKYSSSNVYHYAYVKEYYKNGKMKKSYPSLLVDGKRIYDGEVTEYYENGKKKQESIYKTYPPKFDVAYKDGTWKYYNTKGNLEKEEIYKDGELKTINEYKNNNRIKEIQLTENEYKYVQEYKYVDSYSYYIEKKYYLDQNNNLIWDYEEYGLKNYRSYLKLKGEYKNGVREGEWKKYDANGNLIETIIYMDGKDINDIADEIEEQEKWNTPQVEYYPSGRVKSYSDGPFEAIYEDKDINFIELENFVKNIEKEVEEYIKTKDEEMGYSVSISLNEGMGSNIPIYSLNKNLTSREKKKLQELQVRIEKCHEKASQIWGAQ